MTSQPEPMDTPLSRRVAEISASLRAAGAARIEPPDANPKTRFGMRKPAFSAVPAGAMVPLMQAMAQGRRKYGLANWRIDEVSCSIYYDAAFRHLLSWFDGEETDRESGVHHLGHVMACCAILLDAEECEMLIDDRPPAGKFAALIHAATERHDGAGAA
ncbi:MAG: dATP/dGTP diphosphohydrolase domain-containing protein [Pseudomonadota bacterium]